MEKINHIDGEKHGRLLRASAQALPDRPTAAGMLPDDIRRALWMPMLGSGLSLFTEQNRIVEETNRALTELDERMMSDATNLEKRLSEERTVTDGALGALGAALEGRMDESDLEAYRFRTETDTALDGKVDKESLDEDATKGTVAKRTKNGCLFAKTNASIAGDDQLINRGYLEDRLSPIGERLEALGTGLSGNARSYVLEDLAMLSYALTGTWVFGDKSFYSDALITGDNLLIVQKDAPDFWFEKTDDVSREADSYTYTDAEGVSLTLELRVFDTDGVQVGLLHILESDYTVIEGHSKAASASAAEARESADAVRASLGDVGDLDAALDAILDLQASLIGGGA